MAAVLLAAVLPHAHAARIRPTAASAQAATNSFASRLDAESDAALAPLVMDEKGRFGEDAADAALDEKRPTLEELLAPPPKRPRRRGFEWHDPKLRYGPPPPTFAERLDAASEAAIELPLLDLEEDERAKPTPEPKKSRGARSRPATEVLGTGPERAAAWLLRKYDEIYGDDDDAEPERAEASTASDDVQEVFEPRPWRPRRGRTSR